MYFIIHSLIIGSLGVRLIILLLVEIILAENTKEYKYFIIKELFGSCCLPLGL